MPAPISATRQRIVNALATVPGVAALPWPNPRAFTAHQAWPEWAGLAREAACTGDETWHVIYVLPNVDSASLDEDLDVRLVPLFLALEYIAATGPTVDAVSLPQGDAGNTLPGLRFVFTITRELQP
jgi:hypothetical protein